MTTTRKKTPKKKKRLSPEQIATLKTKIIDEVTAINDLNTLNQLARYIDKTRINQFAKELNILITAGEFAKKIENKEITSKEACKLINAMLK